MRLEELEVGGKVIIQVSINGQFADFPSTVVNVYGEDLIIEPVRINNKVVGFNNEGVKVDLVHIREGNPPISWKNVRCSTVVLKGNTYYRINAFSEGIESNRREAFRLYIGTNAVAQIGANRKATEVIIKDVSETGFSFVTDNDIEDVINMPVRLAFFDYEQNYSLVGIVVRKVVVDEKKFVYGCKLSVQNNEIIKYINKKQREQLSKSGFGYRDSEEEPDDDNATEQRELRRTVKKKPVYNGIGSSERSLDEVDKEERRKTIRNMQIGKWVGNDGD